MNELKTAKLRYEVLEEKLEEYLQSLPYGAKLPPMRSMMEQFQTSQVTVDRSLRSLEERRLIERISGRGYFRRDVSKEAPRALKIDFCFFLKENVISNPLYTKIIDCMLKEMSRLGCFMNIFAYDNLGSVQDFRHRIQHNAPDALFMLACTKVSFNHALRDLGVPFIQVYPNMIEEDVLSYVIDNERAIRMVVDLLYAKGHRRIAFLHGQGYYGNHMLDQEERIEAFYRVMDEKGLSTAGKQVLFGGFSPDEGYQAAMELLDRPAALRPTAIFGNDYNAPGVYRAAQEKGLRIPEDLSVIGFDNLSIINFLQPSLATVDICCEPMIAELARRAYRMAKSRRQEGGLVRTEVELIAGESIGTTQEKPERK